MLIWEFTETEGEGQGEEEWNRKSKEMARQLGAQLQVTDDVDVDKKLESGSGRKALLPPNARIVEKLRGHDARVWKAVWVKCSGFLFAVSVGEDSVINVKSFDGTITKSWRGHDGASIYSCVYDDFHDILVRQLKDRMLINFFLL